jgi:hypothetical protein
MQGEKGLAILVLTLTTTVTLLILPSLFLPLPAQGVFSQEGEVVLSKKPCVEGCDTVHLTQHCWHPCHIDAQGECVNAPCVLHSKSGDTYLDHAPVVLSSRRNGLNGASMTATTMASLIANAWKSSSPPRWR